MFVVAGVSGHTGRVVAETLLERKQPVRVVVRDRAKGSSWESRGAEVAVASLEDAAASARAFQGAQGAYVLIPPRYQAEDPIAAQRPVVDAVAQAVKQSGIPHVVLLSSIGAQHATGTGPVRTLHYAEQAIGKAAKNITMLRAAYFLENWAAALGEAQTNGVLYSFVTPGRALPMVAGEGVRLIRSSTIVPPMTVVATHDIGRVAAEALLDPARGTRIIELVGPRDWTPEDVARELAEVLGRDVRVQGLPLEAMVPAFTAAGMSAGTVKLFQEMTDAINHGRMEREGGRAELRRGTLGPREAFRALVAHTAA